jgi:CubicO group peptidase (beta-lactamase class C family)
MFWIASTSKPMTVTAFMMLLDEGKINVDDPVEKHVPEFYGQMVKGSLEKRISVKPQTQIKVEC